MIPHLAILPILLPIAAAAVLLLVDARSLRLKRAIALTTALLLVAVALLLSQQVNGPTPARPIVYRPGDWPAPFGIVLVVDSLALVMLLLTACLGLAGLVYATARWDGVAPRFHSLFLLLLAGLNGALLTGDLFNLYVFIEVLLIASYGLALHGGGAPRLGAGIHYITLNVTASLLLLFGIAMLYALTGTLNLAAMARAIRATPVASAPLIKAAAVFLGVGFLVKAAAWPLGFWLARTYAVAAPPVAAVFAILTKIGIYIILRLQMLFFAGNGPPWNGFGSRWLVIGGCLTVFYGLLGILSTRRLSRVAGHYLLVSSGTLLAGIGFGRPAILAALLYYLVSATLAVAIFYLMAELVRRHYYGDTIDDATEPVFADEDVAISDEDESETAILIPGTVALLGGGFILATLLLAGLPPLSGFIGKFAIIDSLLQSPAPGRLAWLLIALILLAGLATLVSLTRAGIDLLWIPGEGAGGSRLRLAEVLPIGGLLALSAALVVFAGPAYRHFETTAATLARPAVYIDAVLGGGG